MKIELLYFEDCPTYQETAIFLKEIIKEENLKVNLALVNIDSVPQKEKSGFLGSPTILIDGQDLDGKIGQYFYGCRIYYINGKTTGTLHKDYIWQKLKTFLK